MIKVKLQIKLLKISDKKETIKPPNKKRTILKITFMNSNSVNETELKILRL